MESYLLPSQREHFQIILNILKENHVYCDFSDPGTGKSEIAPMIAKHLNLRLLAIVPADSEVDWREKSEKYGVDVYDILSYEKLRGDKRYGCKNKLLIRSENEYEVTDELLSEISKGLLIVFDEYQRARNSEKLTQKSCVAITKHIIGTKSKIGAPSASPMDLTSQAVGIVKLLGYITHNVVLLEDFILGKTFLDNIEKPYVDAIHELLDVIRNIVNKNNIDISALNFPILVNSKNINYFIKTILVEIILPNIRSRMIANMEYKHKIENTFYEFSPEDRSSIITASDKLKRMIGICMYSGKANAIRQAHNLYDRTTELIRVNIIAREVTARLTEEEDSKCLVFLYNYDSIDKFCRLMNKYTHQLAVYNGKVNKKSRAKIKNIFQKGNDELRILVLNPTVGGTGKSFDDIYGNFPRYVYISPSLRFIDTYQSCFRASRVTTASKSNTHIVYANNVPYERERMAKIRNKLTTMESVIGATLEFPHNGTSA